MVVPSLDKNEMTKACFAALFSAAKSFPAIQPITWRIPLYFWKDSPKLLLILKEYLDWIYSHPVWIQGMEFEQTETDLFVKFDTGIMRIQFMFTMALLRRIDWVPKSILRWHLLGKGKPIPDFNRLLASNFVEFPKFPVEMGNYKEIEASHFVWNVADSLILYKKPLDTLDQQILKLATTLQEAGTYFGDTRRHLFPTNQDEYTTLSMSVMNEAKKYETIISHW
jgi:hypothetical protein